MAAAKLPQKTERSLGLIIAVSHRRVVLKQHFAAVIGSRNRKRRMGWLGGLRLGGFWAERVAVLKMADVLRGVDTQLEVAIKLARGRLGS